MTLTRRQQIEALEKDWATNPRWKNVKRTYTAEEVVELRGSMVPANTIAQRGADKLWSLVNGSAKKRLCKLSWCTDRWSSRTTSESGYRSDLPIRLAGCGR